MWERFLKNDSLESSLMTGVMEDILINESRTDKDGKIPLGDLIPKHSNRHTCVI